MLVVCTKDLCTLKFWHLRLDTAPSYGIRSLLEATAYRHVWDGGVSSEKLKYYPKV